MNVRSDLCLDDIRPFLGKTKKSGGQLIGTCPICLDDHHLYITEKNGKLLCFCHKCNANGADIIKAFIALGAKPSRSVVDESPKLIEDYAHVYKNPDGSVAYYKQRRKYSDGKKKFTFYQINTVTGEKVYKKPANCNNLYNLDLLENALREHTTDTVYIVEGEKCADAMTKRGLLATTANTGAQKDIKLSSVDLRILSAFPIRIVIPDNDEKGTDYAAAFADVKILPLKDIWQAVPPKGDIADYFENGGSVDAILNYKFKEPVNLDRDYFEKLDRFQMVDNSLFEAMFSITEPSKREQIVAMADFRATALGISRSFNKCWKAYLQAQAAKNIKSDNMTKFPNQLFMLRCGEWVADIQGVRKLTTQSERQTRYEFASPIPIMPVEILANQEDNTEKIRLAYFKDGAWRKIVVNRSTIASSNKIIELADYGIEVNSDNSKMLVKYLADVVALNPDILPKTKSIGHLGWFENEFIPYDTDIQLDCEEQYRTLINSVSEKGTLEEWIEYMRPLRKNVYLRLIMAASFASPLLAKVNALPFVLHLWGGTGSGKTVGMMVAASIWGNPLLGRLTRSMNMTVNSMMATAAVLKNLPFFGDELQTIKSRFENYDTLIMRVCEGVDRGRMTNTTLQKQLTWCNSFIFTGEEPCTQMSSGGGVKNRVIEVECIDKIIENGNAVVNFIGSHYGTAGPKFIEILQEQEDLVESYHNFHEMILEDIDTTEKQAMAGALILLADIIVSKELFNDLPSLDIYSIKPFLKSVSEVDTAERAYAMINDIIAENGDKFETYKDVPAGTLWGKIIERESVLINKTVLERELNKIGFDFNAIKKKWLEKGYLEPNSQGRYFHRTSLSGIKSNFVKIRIKV